jgi:DinB family protein
MANYAQPFLDRLDTVEQRLSRLAQTPAPDGLTDPDEPSGERWNWGEVWAHLAEFPGYWTKELRKVPAGGWTFEPPFGRTKADPARIQAIERDRHVPPSDLMDRLRSQLADLRRQLMEMSPEDWRRRVTHPTLGILGMGRVMEEFLVGHLEAHAAQLDSLVEGS